MKLPQTRCPAPLPLPVAIAGEPLNELPTAWGGVTPVCTAASLFAGPGPAA